MTAKKEEGTELPSRSERSATAYRTGGERSKRQERAGRILDVAAELIQRWGYKKTTIDDIARLAGVAKGTIYLHWKTREDLFTALFLRESVKATVDILERIKNDPVGVLMSRLVKHTLAIIMVRPLSRALFTHDLEVLGELARTGQEDVVFLSQRKMVMSHEMLEMMRSNGMLRTDRSVDEQIQMYASIIMGYMTVNDYLPNELQLSPEAVSDMAAETIHRTLEPDEPVSPQAVQEMKASLDQVFEQFMVLMHERLQKEME